MHKLEYTILPFEHAEDMHVCAKSYLLNRLAVNLDHKKLRGGVPPDDPLTFFRDDVFDFIFAPPPLVSIQ